jgi:hypothetical protein
MFVLEDVDTGVDLWALLHQRITGYESTGTFAATLMV